MSGTPVTPAEIERIEDLTVAGFSAHRIAGELARSHNTIQKHQEAPDVQQRIAKKLDILAEKAIDSITEEDYRKASLVQKTTAAAIAIDKRQLLLGLATSINVTVLLDAVAAIREQRKPNVIS